MSSAARRLLIVEDEHALSAALALAVRRAGHLPETVASGAAALDRLRGEKWDAMVLDIGLPDMSGLEVLARLREHSPHLPVLVITAHATLDHALRAQKNGATIYLTKPLDLARFDNALHSALAPVRPSAGAVRRQVPAAVTLIGSAPAMQPVFLGIARACAATLPVLIAGPSGAGKSLAAAIVHAHRGSGGQIATLDCRSMPDPIPLARWIDTNAHVGTLVLDEVTALSPAAQAAIARRLAAGEGPPILLTTRADSSSHGVEYGLLPELFYTVSAATIELPPLRQRLGDIPALVAFFLGLREAPAPVPTETSLAILQRHDWPGNVRELRHVLDAAAALSHDHRLLPCHLPASFTPLTPDPALPLPATELEASLGRWLDRQPETPYDELLDSLETSLLRQLLERHDGKVTWLAAERRLNRATLRQKLRRLGLDENHARPHPYQHTAPLTP